MNTLDQQLTELFKDPAFEKEAKNITSVEEFQTALEAHGIGMTEEQVTELCIAIGRRASNEATDAELTEEELSGAAGGFGVITWTCIGIGVLCVGAFALGVYNGYKSKK